MSEGKAVPSAFSPEEIREIKKVFSMVDTDGSGCIDATELSKIITDLTKEKPSQDALQRFIQQVDGNVDGKKDGKIQLEEFITALSHWVKAENVGSSTPARSRKRARESLVTSPREARAKLHKKIAAFFVCFKQSSDFESIRRKFTSLEHKSTTQGLKDDSHKSREKKSEADIKKLLEKCENASTKMSQFASAINGNDLKKALEATWIVADILSIVEILHTPERRFKHSEVIIKIFSRVKEMLLIPRIVLFLKEVEHPKLQYQAARVLTYYAPGPRIAHTPTDSAIHPDKMLHKKEVIRANAIETLKVLLISPSLPVLKQSAIALGTIASYNHEARDYIISQSVVQKLYNLITPSTPLDLLRPVTWALSIFCGHTHDCKNHEPDYKIVGCLEGLEKFNYIINRIDDPETLVNSCCAMSYLLPGIDLHKSVIRRLCELLRYPNPSLQTVLIRCFTDLISLETTHIRDFLDLGLLTNIQSVLKSSTSSSEFNVRLRATELVSILAEKGYTKDVIKADLIPSMVYLVFNDEFVRFVAMKVIKYTTRGQPDESRYLVKKQDIVKTLANSLSFFKMYDSVLRDVYNYYGPTFNFTFIEDVVDALNNLLGVANQNMSVDFINHFDMEIIDKLNTVIKTLVSEVDDEMLAWGDQRDKGVPVEQEIKFMMLKIAELHEKAKTPVCMHIAKSVKRLVREFETLYKKCELKRKRQLERRKKQSQLQQSTKALNSTNQIWGGFDRSMSLDVKGTITVKCFFNGDNRSLQVPLDVNFKSLERAVGLKYGRTLIMTYEDNDGDKMTIESDAILRKAFQAASGGLLKIYLVNKYKSVAISADWKGNGGGGGKNTVFQGMLQELQFETHFSPNDLRALNRQFQKSSMNGRLTKSQFVKEFQKILQGKITNVQAVQLFNSFDKSKDGSIDFREFVIGLSVFYKGDLEERLQLCFDAYDENGDMKIDKFEFFKILEATFNSQGGVPVEKEMIEKLVDNTFDEVDLDVDGCLNFEEFKKAVMTRKIILDSFWTRKI